MPPHRRVLVEEVSPDYDERLGLTLRRVEHGAAASDAYTEGVRASAERRLDSAIDALRRATREAPTFGEAWLAWAEALLATERRDEAVEVHQGASEFQTRPAAITGMDVALAQLAADEEEAAALAEVRASPPAPAAVARERTPTPATAVQPPAPTPER